MEERRRVTLLGIKSEGGRGIAAKEGCKKRNYRPLEEYSPKGLRWGTGRCRERQMARRRSRDAVVQKKRRRCRSEDNSQ